MIDLWIIYFSKVRSLRNQLHTHTLEGYAYCLSLRIRPYQSNSQLLAHTAFWLDDNLCITPDLSIFTAPSFFSDLRFSGILSHISTILDIILSHGARDRGGNCLSDWRVGFIGLGGIGRAWCSPVRTWQPRPNHDPDRRSQKCGRSSWRRRAPTGVPPAPVSCWRRYMPLVFDWLILIQSRFYSKFMCLWSSCVNAAIFNFGKVLQFSIFNWKLYRFCSCKSSFIEIVTLKI